MYHFFIKKEQAENGVVRITGRDVNHIRNVLRMKAGEEIMVSDEEQNDYYCTVSEVGEDFVEARISFTEIQGHELPSRITLFQGLPKGDKMELIIQKAVELGASAIVPVAMKRSVVRLDEKKAEAKRKRWQAIAESAAKQSKRSLVPVVQKPAAFGDAVSDAGKMDLFFLPYEAAEGMQGTKKALEKLKKGQQIAVMIGPEGGFAEEEIEEARKNGAEVLSLGKRILRTETAGFAVLSALMLALEEIE